MDIRLASMDDVDAIVDLAGIVDPPSTGAEVDRDYYATIIEVGRMTVADASGIVIGYCGAIPVGTTRQLADLFVHSDAHGRGVGRDLLDAVWDASAREVPRQTFSSVHPSALPLYVRAGMRPRWPLLYIEGDPAAVPSTHLTVRDVEPDEASRLEESWLGWNRNDTYSYWSSRKSGRTFAVTDADTPVAVGCMSRSRSHFTLLHMAMMDSSFVTDAVSAACTLATDNVLLAAPGMSKAVPWLLDAGLRVLEHDLYCASETDLFDPERLIPHPGLL